MAKRGCAPKNEADGRTLAEALVRFTRGKRPRHTADVADFFVRVAGSIPAKRIGPMQVNLLNGWIGKYPSAFTRHHKAIAAKTVLRHLIESWGAKKELLTQVDVPAMPRPRNTTATMAERAALLRLAKPHMRCWLLLCSDLAIRSGTAAKLTPSSYDAEAGVLRFRTKYEAINSLPVTRELAVLLDRCPEPNVSFIAQLSGRRSTYGSLSVQFRKLRKAAGVQRQITPHDLRRTTARSVYQITKDLRTVQALLGHADLAHTAWYLQDDMTPVPASALELAKLNPATEVIQ